VRKKNRTVDVTDNFSQIQNLPANNQFVGGEKKKIRDF
jgi:hypothetical protein